MDKEMVLENKIMTVWYHPDTKIVHHKMYKFDHAQGIREGLSAGIELLKKHNACKWLSDDRDNPVLKEEDLEWSQKEFGPRAVEAGWKYWALVKPVKFLGQMAMDKVIEDHAKIGVTVKIFSDPDEGMEWLKSM